MSSVHRFGPYELQRVIGSGGVAEVWLAIDPRTGEEVAIKLLREALTESDAAGLRREAGIMGRARHPNVVELLDLVEHGGRIGLVMERCVGSLEDWVRANGPLPPAAVVEVGEQLLAGLSHAHAQDVLHRDLKPANLLVGRGGEVKIGDFGIATLTERRGRSTHSSAVWGTLPFLAPERRFGWGVTAATDLYAAALTLAWLATGTSVGELHVPVAEQRLRQRVPGPLAEVLVQAAQYRATDRFASAEQMRLALHAAGAALDPVDVDLTEIPAGSGLETMGPPPANLSGASSTSRTGVALLGIAATVAGLGAGLAGWALLRAPARIEASAPALVEDPPAAVDAGASSPATLPRCEWSASQLRSMAKLGPRESVGAVAADLDLDGAPELVFTNQMDESLTLYWGGVEPLMSEATTLGVGRSAVAAAVGDVDEDGHIDLLTAHQDDGALALHRGRPGRRFSTPERIFQAPTAVRVSIVDWNLDGHLDVMMGIDEGGQCTAWRRGRGDGTFEDHICIGPLATGVRPFGADPPAVYRIDDEGRFVRHRPSSSSLMGPAEVLLTAEQLAGHVGNRVFAHAAAGAGEPTVFVFALSGTRDDLIAVWASEPVPRACIYTSTTVAARDELPTTADVADVNGDGRVDLLGVRTCAGCQSNHVVSLAFP